MYFESKSSKLTDELHEVVVRSDKLKFDLRQKVEECEAYQKQVSHLEQALEKVQEFCLLTMIEYFEFSL